MEPGHSPFRVFFELGYNIDLKWISGNLNLYYMDFRDELILNGAMGTNGLPIRVNAAKSFRTGAELSLVCVPVKGLELVNSTSWSLGRVNTAEEILTHVMSPSWLVNQDVSYSFSGVTAGVGMKYRSRMYMDLTNFTALRAPCVSMRSCDGRSRASRSASGSTTYSIREASPTGCLALKDRSISSMRRGISLWTWPGNSDLCASWCACHLCERRL